MIDLVVLFSNMPKELATFLIAMIPVGELRVSIPIGIAVYRLPVWQVVLLSVIGNITPAVLLLAAYGPLSRFLSKRFRFCQRLFDAVFRYTTKKHKVTFEKWGPLALITFVAIPLPLTGAWSGSVAAFAFGVPFGRAVCYLFLGVSIAATIVTAMTLAGGKLLTFLSL